MLLYQSDLTKLNLSTKILCRILSLYFYRGCSSNSITTFYPPFDLQYSITRYNNASSIPYYLLLGTLHKYLMTKLLSPVGQAKQQPIA